MDSLLLNYPILSQELVGNTIAVWLRGVIIFFLAFLALKLLRVFVIGRLKKIFSKTKTELDDLIINAIDAIYWPFYVFASAYIAIQFVWVPAVVKKWSFSIFMVIVIYYAIKFVSELIDFGAKMIISHKAEEDQQNVGIIKLISAVAKIILWVGAIVLILANMGYNVTSLIAGLGVGGIAVALALQNILGDIFSSLSIYFDKPFKIGDFIVIGDKMGTVTKVGIKTTRIAVPNGEELVMANSELTKSQVQNFGVMERRRGLHHIGVTYSTPKEKLERIPKMFEEIITNIEDATFDRAHFKEFGDSALIYELVYYIETGDYKIFMEKQQAINLGIVGRFASEGIEIAFPTQTVHIKNS